MYKFFVGIITGLLLSGATAFGQCNTEPLIDKASAKLGDFTFLKSYKIDGNASNEVEHSYVFSKETMYFLAVHDGKDEVPQIEIVLLDSNRKPIATNYDKKTSKYFPGLAYKCSATGIFYMVFKINSPSSKCAVSVIGFKKS